MNDLDEFIEYGEDYEYGTESLVSCFTCGDDVAVDPLLEVETVLCDMCSAEWEHAGNDYTTNDGFVRAETVW